MYFFKHLKSAGNYQISDLFSEKLTFSVISREFLAPGAPNEINIDGKTMEKTLLDLKSPSR